MKTFKLPDQDAYPKHIHFGSESYKLVFVEGLEFYGDTNPVKKRIRVKKGLSARQTLATIVHELLHVIEFEAPVKLKHKTVYKLERALLEILLDNFL